MYPFSCNVALSTDPSYTIEFTALDDAALKIFQLPIFYFPTESNTAEKRDNS